MSEKMLDQIKKLEALHNKLSVKLHSLRRIIDQTPGLVVWKDTDSIFQGHNLMSANSLVAHGYPSMKDPNRIVGKRPENIYDEATAALSYAEDAITVDRNFDQTLLRMNILRNHKAQPLLIRKAPLLNMSGDPDGVICSCMALYDHPFLSSLCEKNITIVSDK